MQVWFIERIDRDDDNEILYPCVSEEVARREIARLEQQDAEFAVTFGIDPAYRYVTYSVDVVDTAD